MELKKITFEELEKSKGWKEAVVVFTKESFEIEFSETERSYEVQSDAKYFDASKGGNSLFGNCLDGKDDDVRLDRYMHLLPEEGARWEVDYCYITKHESKKMDNTKDKEVFLKIVDIAKRAENKELLAFDRMSLIMDLESANEEFDLRLDALLDADDFNFAHDIIGIQNNLDRKTKKMKNFFVPRYASVSKD